MAYYIGVDGGGTKTLFALAGEDMEIIATHTCAGGSYKDKGVAAVVDMLHGGVLRLLSESSVVPSIAIGDIAGICFGLPCFGESAEGDRLLSAELTKRFWGTPIAVVNDSEVGWAGSLGMNPGVNIVAGTGSIAFGRDASGRTARCGGWSEFFSDEGSCYWLGRKTMGLFSKQ
ncbi:MAG: ATPase, partial [Oscillospiraceae bacterium]|nr:ATPase [Oscillospiraceae bacterium]